MCNRSQKFASSMLFLSFGLYLLHVFLATLTSRGLYSDGANFFVGLLSGNHYWPYWDDSKHIRIFVNILNQLPTSIALLFGVDNISILRFLFNAGLFFTPLVFYAWCGYLSFRANDFRIFSFAFVGFSAFVVPSEMFAINQAITTIALCWVLIHYALLEIRLRGLDYLGILMVLLLLFRSHESMLIWGAMLSFSASVGITRNGSWLINRVNLHQYLIIFGGALHTTFVVWWQFNHPVSQQTVGYLQLLGLAMPGELWQGNTRITLILLTILFVMAAVYYARDKCKNNISLIFSLWIERIILLFSLYSFVYGFFLFLDPLQSNPYREYQYRFLITFGMVVMMLPPAFIKPIAFHDIIGKYRLATVFVSLCFIGATVWQVANTVYWSSFQRVTAHTLITSDKVVVSPEAVQRNMESSGLGYLYRYRWDWTWPVLGLSLQTSKNVHGIYRPEAGFDDYFKLPKGEQAYPYLPFIQFTPNGYFDFYRLTNACNQGACD